MIPTAGRQEHLRARAPRTLRIVTAVAALYGFGAPPARAQSATFEGAGQATISSGDLVRARERALDEAFRQAVDLAAAPRSDGKSAADRSSALKLSIDPRARAYVQSYRVLDEGEQSGSFHIRVSAEVATARLEHDLAEALTRGGGKSGSDPKAGDGGGAATTGAPTAAATGKDNPSTMKAPLCLSVRDDLATSAAPSAWPDRVGAQARALGEEGLYPPAVPCAINLSDENPPDAAAADAARAAKKKGALAGRLRFSPLGPVRGTALLGIHARVALHLVDADGKVLASNEAERDGYGETVEAAEQGTGKACIDQALSSLRTAWEARFGRAEALGVTVHLDGARSYSDVQAMAKALGAVPGVSAAEPRRFSASGVDVAVRGEAPTAALCAGLTRAATSDGARYQPKADGEASVTVTLLPPAPATASGSDGAAAGSDKKSANSSSEQGATP